MRRADDIVTVLTSHASQFSHYYYYYYYAWTVHSVGSKLYQYSDKQRVIILERGNLYWEMHLYIQLWHLAMLFLVSPTVIDFPNNV